MIGLLLSNWKWLVIAALAVVIGFLYLDVQRQKSNVAQARLEKSELEKGYAKAVQNATVPTHQIALPSIAPRQPVVSPAAPA